MKYREGYKYQLYQDERFVTALKGKHIVTDWIEVLPDGTVIGKRGYAWDGASGPTWDTKNSMRASLIHDIGYQLMREGLISLDWKEYFDGLFYLTLIHDGMNRLRALVWYNAVYSFGKNATLPVNDRPILEAP
jgi:hypothetical protein